MAGSCRRDYALESRGSRSGGRRNSRTARPVSACHAPSLATRTLARSAESAAGLRVNDLLNHPAFQGAIAPFVVALIVAFALGRTRFAWVAILPAYATMVALDTGFALSPLTVSRRSWLIALIAPLVGAAADSYRRSSRRIAPAMTVGAALVSLWVYWTLIAHHEGWRSAAIAAGIAIYFAALVAAVLRLRDDGLRCGAAGLGLGVAAGIAGILSASIGALVAGASLAAACGAMLVVQIALARAIAPGFTGALPIGMIAALIAVGAQQLAELPWYALLLMLLVPLATSLPAPRPESRIARAAVLFILALVAALLPIAAAWNAARTSLS